MPACCPPIASSGPGAGRFAAKFTRVFRCCGRRLPVNLKGHFPGFKVWTRAEADIRRISEIWTKCLASSGGPFLFGSRTMADAMYAPVVTRFMTYDVKLDGRLMEYCRVIMEMPEMQEWIAAAKLEPEDIQELEVEF